MEDLIQIIFSGIVIFSTVVYAVLTWRLVKETKKIRLFQIKPDIRVYFERGEANEQLLYIVVENQGFGAALNVSFQILKNLESYKGEYFNLKGKGVFKHGIVTLYPSQRHRYFVLPLEKENFDKIISETLIVKVNYRDITDKKFEETFSLPIIETVGVGKSIPPDTYSGRVPFYLEKIDKSLKGLSAAIDKLVRQ